MWERNIEKLPSCTRPDWGIKPTTGVCAPTGNRTCKLWCTGGCSNQPSHRGKGWLWILLSESIIYGAFRVTCWALLQTPLRIILFNPYNNPLIPTLLLYPLCRWGKWGTEKLQKLPRILHLWNGRAWRVLFQCLCSCPESFAASP